MTDIKNENAEINTGWLRWPIGLIGYVPPASPITHQLLVDKVDEAVQVGANVIAFPCEAEGYALWPTDLLPPAKNAHIPDVFGTFLEIAHEAGLKVIAHWMGVHVQSALWDRHPSWLQRGPDGNLITALPGGSPWPAMCLNSPFAGLFNAQMREILSKYPVDAVYSDGIYQRFTGCYCEFCREKYKEQHQESMPQDSLDRRMLRFREDIVCEFLAQVRDTIDHTSPETPFVLDTVGSTLSWLRGEDIRRMSQYIDVFLLESYWEIRRQLAWTDGMEFRITQAQSGKPVWLPKWLARNPDYEQVATPEATVRVWMGQTLVNAAPPVGVEQNLFQVDPSGIPVLTEVYADSRMLQSYLERAEPLANVALFYSSETFHHLGPQKSEEILENFQGAYQALLEHHVPFEVVNERQVLSGDLDNYEVLVIPNAICMSDELLSFIHKFVQDGGGLVFTYRSGLQNVDGSDYETPSLHSMAGIRSIGVQVAQGPRMVKKYGGKNPVQYYRILTDHPICQGFEERLTAFSGSSLRIDHQNDVQPIAYLLGYDNETLSREGFFNWYPGDETTPLATVRGIENGGRVVYFSGDITRAYWLYGWPELASLFVRSIYWASQKPAPFEVISDHPMVEVRCYRRSDDGAVTILFCNLATNQFVTLRGGGFPFDPKQAIRSHFATNIVTQTNICLRLQNGIFQGKQLRSLKCSSVSIKSDGEWTSIEIPRLEAYEVLIFE